MCVCVCEWEGGEGEGRIVDREKECVLEAGAEYTVLVSFCVAHSLCRPTK